MKRAAIAAALASITLVACAGSAESAPPSDPSRAEVTLDTGNVVKLRVVMIRVQNRDVACVVATGYREGSVSCDFARLTLSG